MPPLIERIKKELVDAGISFDYIEDKIHIELPNNFDTLIIEIWKEEEDSISLLNGDFHTHGDIEARENGLKSREKGIRHLVECIFNGKFKMVELKNIDGSVEKTIWDYYSLESIHKYSNYEIIKEI